MSGLLARLNKKREEMAAAASTAATTVGSSNGSSSSSSSSSAPPVEVQQSSAAAELATSAPSSPGPTEETTNNKDEKTRQKTPQKQVTFISNTIPSKLTLDRLVWVNYYRWNTMVPARLCDNQEALDEPTIEEWPIPEDKAVVEICGQIEEKGHTRVLLVEREKMFPLWAKNIDEEKSDYESQQQGVLQKWNEYRVKFLQNKILKFTQYNVKNRELVFETMMKVANQLLQKALESPPPPTPSAKQLAVDGANLTTPSKKKRSIDEVTTNSPVGKMGMEMEDASSSSSSPYEHKAKRPTKPLEPLAVGDEICYFDRMLTDKLKFAKITRIDEQEDKQPLELDNDDVLDSHCQIAVKPKDESAFPVDPISKRPTVPFFILSQYMKVTTPTPQSVVKGRGKSNKPTGKAVSAAKTNSGTAKGKGKN